MKKTLGKLIKEKRVVFEHFCSSEINRLQKIDKMVKKKTMKKNSLNIVCASSRNFKKNS